MHRILIVDDERSLRITVQALLQKAGYTVDTAENASTALELIAANDYDVILTDIIMPRMDGMNCWRTSAGSPSLSRFWS